VWFPLSGFTSFQGEAGPLPWRGGPGFFFRRHGYNKEVYVPTIHLTEPVAKLLVDVIDMHVQGIAESKELTCDDPTVDTADQLLDLMAGYDMDMMALKDIRQQLSEVHRDSGT
jgi:hypothetical protein